MELLEYILQVRGAAVAGAEVRGLAGEMNKLAVSQERVGASGDKAAAGSAKMASAMGLVGKVAKVGALGLAAIGLEAVKMSTQFNHEMLRVQTETGGTAKELANMKNAVLDLAASGKSMGQGPQSLALGLYHLESLGLRGKKAIHALTLASQEAAISGASLEQTTSALGAAMFVGVKGAGSLDNIMALLNATVGSGNMRFAQLIESLGTGVLGAFKAAHLSIQDMSASVAVLTDGGYPASSAMAQLSTALHFLYSPSMKASNAMDSVGLSGRKLYGDLQKPRGLLVALKDLHAHLKNLSGFQQSQVLTSILPGGRGRVLLNLYEQIGRLQGKYGQEKSIMGEFKTGVRIQVHDPQTQLKTAEAGVQASLIRLGNVLTPIVLPALTAILHVGKDVLDWLTALPAHIKAVVGWFQELPGPVRTIITLVGLMAGQAILLTTLAKAFGAVKTAIELLGGAFGKLTLKKLGIMALVAVAILIVTHWKEVKKWIDHNKAAAILLAAAIAPIAAAVASAFVIGKLKLFMAAIQNIFPFIATLLGRIGLVGPATEAASVAGIAANGRFGASFLALLGPIGAAAAAVGGLVAAGNAIGNKLSGGRGANPGSSTANPFPNAPGAAGANILGLHIGGPGGQLLNTLGLGATGAVVTRATRAVIGEAGPEAVVPLSKMPGASPLGGSSRITPVALAPSTGAAFHVHVESPVYIDGREIARAHHRQVIKAMAAGA